MSAIASPAQFPVHTLVRWLARVSSLGSIALLVAFAFGGAEKPPALADVPQLLFFPIGVCLGMLVAWRRECLGALVSLLSLSMFYVVCVIRTGTLPVGPFFLLFTSPAFLFLAAGLLALGRGRMRPAREYVE